MRIRINDQHLYPLNAISVGIIPMVVVVVVVVVVDVDLLVWVKLGVLAQRRTHQVLMVLPTPITFLTKINMAVVVVIVMVMLVVIVGKQEGG